jgi:hypothetical protein
MSDKNASATIGLKKKSDLAPGPAAGYIFQFELALLSLAKLEKPGDFITIENLDDVTAHSEGTIVITIQAKHSISNGGSTFNDTSYALWRTLQIWIQKLESGLFDKKTQFICATNKKIPGDALVRKMATMPFKNLLLEIETIHKIQLDKFNQGIKKGSQNGKTLQKTIDLISYVLSKKELFEVIKDNLKINDDLNVLNQLESALFLSGEMVTQVQKELFIEAMVGWITTRSRYKWNYPTIAKFTRQELTDKYNSIRSNHSIMNAIFREKKSFEKIPLKEMDAKRLEIFVRQIKDLDRRSEAKEDLIKNAIKDFIYCDIELKYVIDQGNYTEKDFNDFKNNCFDEWWKCNTTLVKKEISTYDEQQLNDLGIQIYDEIMFNARVKFDQSHSFTPGNEYIRNGCFLKLSNVPTIGWHPGWKKKYQDK